MIVRISGEGQFDVPDGHLEELNRLDDDLTKAVDSGDDAQFTADLVLPSPDSTIHEVREVLGDEGLIPG